MCVLLKPQAFNYHAFKFIFVLQFGRCVRMWVWKWVHKQNFTGLWQWAWVRRNFWHLSRTLIDLFPALQIMMQLGSKLENKTIFLKTRKCIISINYNIWRTKYAHWSTPQLEFIAHLWPQLHKLVSLTVRPTQSALLHRRMHRKQYMLQRVELLTTAQARTSWHVPS